MQILLIQVKSNKRKEEFLTDKMLAKWLRCNENQSRVRLCVFVSLILVVIGISFLYQSISSHYLSQYSLLNVEKSEEWRSKTASQSPDDEAEKDSSARKKQVESVCRNLSISKILGPLNRMDEITMERRKILHKRLIVNEEHKVIYCIVPKVGCTQLKRIFLVLNGVYSSIEEVTDIHDMTKHTYIYDKKFSDKKREYMLKNFYKFIIVRDPLERLVSAYRNKFEGKTMQFMLPWELKIAKEIVKRYRYNNEEIDLHKVNNVTFPEYINYIIDTPSLKLNAHWMPYRDLCRPCEIHYDFIGSMDTYMRDVKHIMRQIKADGTKFYAKNRTTLIATKKSTASFYKDLPKKHFDRLVKKFKLDHELFGYSLPEFKSLDKRYPSK